ncbi:hypothetical protein BDW22DRAFT_1360130 [Trametopsis cervina]|nr:hypothetical protein BDW22DRAFT_1360130 [Trametopsis cervina]
MASVEAVPACLLVAPPPVVQPPHLEGDPTLATEILPGPPSLQTVQQLGIPKKDHKKSAVVASYLPASDPGTTYGAYTVSTMATTAEVDGPRRKRARLDKDSATSRAQRASARRVATAVTTSEQAGTTGAIASSSHLPSEPDNLAMQIDSDDAQLSRSNSAAPIAEDPDSNYSSVRTTGLRDKGKGKERAGGVRVKEEPGLATSAIEPVGAAAASNEDHCSACRSLGSLVYCDGCPRAYHLWCLNPPMEAEDLPAGDARWFCPSCSLGQKPPIKPSAGLKFMAPLVEQIESSLPSEFSLPQDVRTFFKDVATGPKGNYVDSSELKPPRLNRHGQLEEREPYRLRDRNGEPVLCYKCGTSALPPDLAAAAPAAKRARRATSTASSQSEVGRGMISCDYCHLHWHLDCVDPPLAYMPPWNKKWMCPNHAEQVVPLKRRIPKANAPPIEITKPNERNNGNIEVILPETPAAPPPKLAIDEVLINGRRYRVPERVITMDFWNKSSKKRPQQYESYDISSAASSPLSSLSSLPDDDMYQREAKPHSLLPRPLNLDELRAVVSLCDMVSRPAIKLPAASGTSSATLALPKSEHKVAPRKAETTTINVKVKAPEEPTPVVHDQPVNGIVQPPEPTRRSARSSVGRRLRPWNKTDSSGAGPEHEFDEAYEDYTGQSPSSQAIASALARRQKRDSNGKFIRKPEGRHRSHKAGAHTSRHTSEGQSAPDLPTEPVASSSTRPKRNRQPSRRLESPTAITFTMSGASGTKHTAPTSSTSKAATGTATSAPRSASSSDSPLLNGAPSTSSSITAPSSAAPSSPPTALPSVMLNVPAPTTIHPSLRYKLIAPAVSDASAVGKKEQPAPPRIAPTSRQKPPVVPIEKTASANASEKSSVPASSSKSDHTPTSTGLKIRLPRMGAALLSAPPAAPVSTGRDPSPTRPKAHTSNHSTRPRRSLRRQSSISTSVTGTSLSAPSSPKTSAMGI